MTSTIQLQRRLRKLEWLAMPKGNSRVILHIWLPEDDARHAKTDEQIIKEASPYDRVIVVPTRDKP